MSQRKITFIDNVNHQTESKKIIPYISSTININQNKQYKCWWCTLKIENDPIGCPINLKVERPNEVDIKMYSVDGIFCSFNCVKAYINEKETNSSIYKRSHNLLAHMFCDITGKMSPVRIQPSPDKCLLIDYGGYMTEKQYKSCLDKLVFIKKGIAIMFPTNTIFEEIMVFPDS